MGSSSTDEENDDGGIVKNDVTRDCGVCWTSEHESEDTTCCQKPLCVSCCSRMTTSLCPFCRSPSLPEKQRQSSEDITEIDMDLLSSLPLSSSWPPPSNGSIPGVWEERTYSERYQSRIYRRYTKRLEKLRLRDRDADNNRRLNYMLWRTTSKHHVRRSLREQIRMDSDPQQL